MSISERISYDVECMRDYFLKLLAFATSTEKTHAPESAGCQTRTTFLPTGISYLVRPDMACNVYSLADFWLSSLCKHHETKGSVPTTFDDFKKAERKCGDLQRYKKYLTKVAGLNLAAAHASFLHIDALREVRNTFIHAGGHVADKKRTVIARIPGVSLLASLVVVSESFIWSSLDHANQYLQAVAKA